MTSKTTISHNDIEVRFVEINSEGAKDYLSSSTGNRHLSENRVNHYLDQMRNGKWSPISTIVIDNQGHLKDGHHRMMAQAKCETPNVYILINGVTRDMLSTIDTGRPRSAADYCKFIEELQDITDARRCCSIAKFYIQIREKKQMNTIIDYTDITDFIFEEKDVMQKSLSLCRELRQRTGIKTNFGFATALIKIIKRGDIHLSGFWESLCSGENLGAGNPVLALRNYLYSIKYSSSWQANMDSYMVLAKAWNAVINGNEIRVIKTAGYCKPKLSDVFDIKFC